MIQIADCGTDNRPCVYVRTVAPVCGERCIADREEKPELRAGRFSGDGRRLARPSGLMIAITPYAADFDLFFALANLGEVIRYL